MLRPVTGSVTVFGVNAAAQPMAVRRMTGYVPQLLSADAAFTGRENAELFCSCWTSRRDAGVLTTR